MFNEGEKYAQDTLESVSAALNNMLKYIDKLDTTHEQALEFTKGFLYGLEDYVADLDDAIYG
jgi:hypothetical protein